MLRRNPALESLLTKAYLLDQLSIPPLIDVLLRFRTHRVALTTDVSKMYRAVELVPVDRDLHRFVWRNNPKDPLLDYRMTRVTFGVSASSFAANMAVKQNALDHTMEYPLAAKSVDDSFYVDDGLTGADSIQEAVELQCQLQDLFSKGGFHLRKWNSSELQAIQHLPTELKDTKPTQELPTSDEYTKTLGIQWNALKDCFKLSTPSPTPLETLTKRWSSEYISQLGRFNKWQHPTRNIRPGDLVVIREDSPISTKWPLARVVEVYPGKDNLVRVATIKTAHGTYTRPVNKLAVILPSDEQS